MDANKASGREHQKRYDEWVKSGEIETIQQKIDTLNLINEGPIK
jgi:hypothetical protein